VKAAAAALVLLATPAAAQEAGWHYSPYPGEGDRAAMGCARESTPANHACIVVRCEDDFSVAVYLDTTLAGGDVRDWVVSIDDASPIIKTEAVAPGLPYGARVVGSPDTIEIATLVEALKLSAITFMRPAEDKEPIAQGIPGKGSFAAISQALYYCAPRTEPSSSEQAVQH
jgi:hypothetical protein